MIVAELMTQQARSCLPTESLTAAARIMWESDCGAVPIVDQSGLLVGVITDRDLCMAAYLRGQRLDECLIGDVMSRSPVVCRPSDGVEKAETAMREHQVRRLPVVDENGRLSGILSMNDLLLAARQGQQRRKEVPSEEIMSTLATISQHRKPAAAAQR